MKPQPAQSGYATHPKRFIGVADVAALMGITVAALYDGQSGTRELKRAAVKLGKALRWQEEYVLAWLDQKQREADARAAQERAAEQALTAPDTNVRRFRARHSNSDMTSTIAEWDAVFARKPQRGRPKK